MKKYIGIFFLTAVLFFMIGTRSALAEPCVLQWTGTTTELTPVGCDPETEIGRCVGTGDPTKGAIYQTVCEPINPGVNCTQENRTPTVSRPCCTNLVPFSYPRGTICIKQGQDPYHNCITSGKPESNQTCCVGYALDDNGECAYKVSTFDPSCDDGTGINTAIGCIHVLSSSEAFLSDILKWAVGIGAGIAFLLMLYAGFMIMTASGNPERLKAGQELLTSALAGLILLIFSIFILNFIGVDILGLGQFGFGSSK